MKASTLSVGSRQLGEGEPCLVVAHVGAAHEGSAETALGLIEAAFKAGADAIAFQVFRTEALLVRRHRERPEMEAVGASAPGVAPGPRGGPGLGSRGDRRGPRRRLRGTWPPRPGSTPSRPARATSTTPSCSAAWPPPAGRSSSASGRCRSASCGRLLTWPESGRRCSCAPPRPRRRWRSCASARSRPGESGTGFRSGLLDSTDGSSAFALFAPALAAAHGADFVEKRLTLDRSRKGRDWAAAMSPEEFYRMVELLRQAERAGAELLGGREATADPPPWRGRSIVAASLIGRGEVLTAEMLAFKHTDERFDQGLAPREADRVIGRRARRPIQADETLKEDMLE